MPAERFFPDFTMPPATSYLRLVDWRAFLERYGVHTHIEGDITDLGDYLPLLGGTMSGDIAMGANSITGLAGPVDEQDAATKEYVDSEVYATNSNAMQAGLNDTEQIRLRVSVDVPAPWATWGLFWIFTVSPRRSDPGQNRVVTWRIRHNGSLLWAQNDFLLSTDPNDPGPVKTLSGAAEGLSGTGTRDIDLSAQLAVDDDYGLQDRIGWVRAVRTS